jgi:phosphoserine aminotransferase
MTLEAEVLSRPVPSQQPAAKIDDALRDVERALVASPQSTHLRLTRAAALRTLGRDDEATVAYVEILQRDPFDLAALRGLGRILLGAGKHAAARTVFTQAIAHHPADLESHVQLGNVLLQLNEPEPARATLERALQIAPADPLAHAGMSFALEALGQSEAAARHRRQGFQNRSVIGLPYRGTGLPVPVLLLASTNGGNVPFEHFLDDRVFQTWIVTPEFHRAELPLPDHCLVINAIGDVDAVAEALRAAASVLAATTAPVLNPPAAVARTGRCENWQRLARIPGVVTPRAATLARTMLTSPDAAEQALRANDLAYPILLRSPGFHTGQHFVRVDGRDALGVALTQLPGTELIAMQFLDTRCADGKTRKYRVMMIDGELYPLHVAVSRDWKVHYFSADMAHNELHRAEDARFLADMAAVIGAPAIDTLRRIQRELGLDYGGIDFALDAAGNVVLFEANATMVVCRPEPDSRWDYRRPAVERIHAAVRQMLLARAAQKPALTQPGAKQSETAHASTMRPSPIAPAASRPPSNRLNFSGGPGALPEEVLLQSQQAMIALPETGLSVLGMSHRSDWFVALLAEAEANLRSLMQVPESHAVLLLQGGSSLQFSMIPMNFAAGAVYGAPAYVRSGYWSAKAIEEARAVRPLQVAWDGSAAGYRQLPQPADLALAGTPAYLHYVSNETVEGLQFDQAPDVAGVELIADMSSDLLSRQVDVRRHAMIYAHAQKNLGPAGVTVCVIDRRLMERIPAGLPPMLDYRTHLQHRSNYNTPPVFGIYVLTLVTRWLRDRIGGAAKIAALNRDKAARLYATLDGLGDLVRPHAAPNFRSTMNVAFRFRSPRLDALFLEQAQRAGFSGLAGHRSLGGIRASLYNAVELSAVEELCDFVREFATNN